MFVVLDKSSLAENEGVRLVSDGVRLLCERGSQTADPLEKKEAGCARPANLKKKDQGAGERARSDSQRKADRPPAGAVRHRTDPTESDATALSAILPQAM